ncbi:nitrate reductase [Synechococcus sp. RSCCF101]|uniref:nitrate reductase associated protein n=1 Tax=Synechococcus sp. RSCCF101 TaxID=2511069 RepID=UPI00124804EB|nr:nitrate reductase associated protein [Synechococcus sp. RSCCF101]QEY32618.1 nitrate reductase [Synechococcus sp. RSCCF101]
MDQASHCFAFELDFVSGWRCIPLCLRRKLDLAGVKLKLGHWIELPREERQRLVDWDDSPASLQELRAFLRERTACLADGQARDLPPAKAEPWQQEQTVPDWVRSSASTCGEVIGDQDWQQLTELQRFALCKLARPGHDHHNLGPALREFLPPAAPEPPPP